jgi:hypothetical protein
MLRRVPQFAVRATALLAFYALLCPPLLAQAQVPGAPVGVSAVVSGPIVTLSWSAPNSGGAPTTYLIDAGTSSGASDVASGLSVGNTLGVASPPLAAGTYFVRVSAANQFGPGPVSTEVSFTIQGLTTPGAPIGLTGSVSGTLVTIAWQANPSGGLATGFLVDAGTAPGASNVVSGLAVGNLLTVAGNLAPGGYYIRVRAQNAAGISPPSNEVFVTVGVVGPPGAPTGLNFTVAGGNVSLFWNAPATGGTPTGYRIEAGTATGLSNIVVFNVGPTTGVSAVAPAGVFFVRARAVNATGVSGPSNEVVIVTAPALGTGAFTATLTWNTGSASGTPTWTDIDLHAREPGDVHVYYGSPRGTTMLLDADNTRGFGPENIFTDRPPANGTYEVYVVAYSGNQWPTTARVTIRTNVGTAGEQLRVVERVFTGANSGLAQNVATVTFPGGLITETSGTRVPDEAGDSFVIGPKGKQ